MSQLRFCIFVLFTLTNTFADAATLDLLFQAVSTSTPAVQQQQHIVLDILLTCPFHECKWRDFRFHRALLRRDSIEWQILDASQGQGDQLLLATVRGGGDEG